MGEQRAAVSRIAVLETDGQALVEVGAGRGPRPDRADLLGPLHRRHRLRRHLPPDRPPVRGRPLSDPTAPAVRGELEIPGYSAYLHPIDEGHLLGIGQDADASGSTRGPPGLGLRRDRSRPPHPGRPGRVPGPDLQRRVGPPRLPLVGPDRPGRPAPELRPVHRPVGRPRPRRRTGPHRPARRPGGPPQRGRRRPPAHPGRGQPGHQLVGDAGAPPRARPVVVRPFTTDSGRNHQAGRSAARPPPPCPSSREEGACRKRPNVLTMTLR